MRKRSWNISSLKKFACESKSIRQLILKLGLVPAGGNYSQIKKYIEENNIDTSHFTGKNWNKGLLCPREPQKRIEDLLIIGSAVQSYKLKKRLLSSGTLNAECALCGWAKFSKDGRLPLELDHINGNHLDNRLNNLRILCPNCHSLQITHRGKNKKKRTG